MIEINTGFCEVDQVHFAYVNQFGTEFYADSKESQEDAYRKLATILAERLYRVGQIILTGQISN